jgi:hypothetical protein
MMSVFRVQNVQKTTDTVQHIEWNFSAQDHSNFVDDVSMLSSCMVLLAIDIIFIDFFNFGFQSSNKFNTEHFLEDFGDRGSIKQILGVSDCNGEIRMEESFQELTKDDFILFRLSEHDLSPSQQNDLDALPGTAVEVVVRQPGQNFKSVFAEFAVEVHKGREFDHFFMHWVVSMQEYRKETLNGCSQIGLMPDGFILAPLVETLSPVHNNSFRNMHHPSTKSET